MLDLRIRGLVSSSSFFSTIKKKKKKKKKKNLIFSMDENERRREENYRANQLSNRDLIPTQHYHIKCTTPPHMRVDPTPCKRVLYTCCGIVVNLSFSLL
jgi:hypothetical protein